MHGTVLLAPFTAGRKDGRKERREGGRRAESKERGKDASFPKPCPSSINPLISPTGAAVSEECQAGHAGCGCRAARALAGSEVARWFQNPDAKSMDAYFTNPDKQATCSLSPTRADAAVPTWAPADTAKRESAPSRPHRERGPGGRVATGVACRPTPLARGCGGHRARATGDVRARGRRGRGSAARQQVGASFRARARAAVSPSRSPRVASPPRRERAPPALARGLSWSLGAAHSRELLPGSSPPPRL